jgi:hypothetical protein
MEQNMKRYLFAFLTMALAIAPAQTATKAATKPAPKTAAAKTPKRHPDGRPLGVPFSAVKVNDGAWRAIEDGKPVIYRSTAFGFSKMSEEENAKIQRMIDGKPDAPTEASPGVTVVERDGKLHFSRITPFGDYKWVKEKNDLNPAEKAVWERTQSAQGATKQ